MLTMPTNDFTTKLLDLEDAIIENIETSTDSTIIHFSLKRKTVSCPFCSSPTNKVHDYRVSFIKEIPILGKHTILAYKKRRYHCDCCNKHFYEPFSLVPKHCRTTKRLAWHCISFLADKFSVKSAAKRNGVSPSYIFRRMKDINFTIPNRLPQVLSIDEFRGNAGGQKFQGILTDPVAHKVFDILPSRSQASLIPYFKAFKNRKEVKYFVMDMNYSYRELAETFFPQAMIVIDRFHYVRYVTWALENVRKRVQKSMHTNKRKYFKRSRKILLSRYNKLNEDSKLALEVMLSQSNELAVAYHLKEKFYEFLDSADRNEALKRLHFFILAAQTSQLKEFMPVLTMLGNWTKYILNSFECPYTNGFTEGTNNAIKVIKRNAFGYRNFENFRNRILLALT
jgi:transposase